MRILLFSAFGHIGFEIVNHALEEGFEVHHIHLINNVDMEFYQDEKELWIGRNSNFKEIEALSPPYDHILVPAYDWKIPEAGKQKIVESIHSINDKLSERSTPLTILINAFDDEWLPKFSQLKNKRIIKLPHLYGKWQPKSSLFYQLLQKNTDSYHKYFNHDAIHAKDAASSIVDLIQEKDIETLRLTNQDENRMKDCLQYLLGTQIENDPQLESPLSEERVIYIKERENYQSILEEMVKLYREEDHTETEKLQE